MIGIAQQEPNLDRFLTVHETLVYHGGYYGMSGEAAAARAEEMIDVFDLRAKRDTRAPKLSGGCAAACSSPARCCTSRAW